MIITTTEFGSLTGFDNGSGTIQDQIDSKPSDYDVSAPLVKTARGVVVFSRKSSIIINK